MISLIENAIVVGRSCGERNLLLIENQENGAVNTLVFNGQQEMELGTKGVLEFSGNVIISFIPSLEEVLA